MTSKSCDAVSSAKPNYPCPYCGERCIKSGFYKGSVQRYICTSCRRINYELMPGRRNALPGSTVITCTFSLGPGAALALIAYCNRHNFTQAQAVRDIFGKADSSARIVPTSVIRNPMTGSSRQVPVDSDTAPNPLPPLPRTLPNIYADVLRQRMSRDPEICRRPTVYVSAIVRVSLDEKAYRGLYGTMLRCGWNHQEAARFLITETNRPIQTPIAIHR